MHNWSFWEKDTWLRGLDLLVIGGGIVGLSAAIHYKKRFPGARILLVEKGSLPSGGSTRNAGFACFGSLSEILDDIENIGLDNTMALIAKRYKGLQSLRALIGDAALCYQNLGGYEVFTEADDSTLEKCLEIMPEINRRLEDLLGVAKVFEIAPQVASEMGLKGIKQVILNQCEGQIHSGNMMQAYIKLAVENDIRILNGIHIRELEAGLEYGLAHAEGDITFKAKQILVATNGFARMLLHDLEVEPGRAQVLVTKPIPGLKLRGCFHYEKGYYYFRNHQDRVLIGGGRHLDFKSERTYSQELTYTVQDKLEELLSEMILPGIPYQVDSRWAGTLGLGNSRAPIVKPYRNRIFCAVRMGGMGVAIGTEIGKEAAELMAGHIADKAEIL